MKHQIELRHYRYFLAVADTLHFRKAAEQLFISQPGLSRQIKQLEENLGVQLFERHNRKVTLTPAGKYLQEELKNIFKQLNAVLAHTKLLHGGGVGKLKLGYVGSAMQKLIPNLLLQFQKEHPHILIHLNEMDNQQQLQALLNKDIDVGFIRQERIPSGLKIKATETETFSLVLPKNHEVTLANFKSLQQFEKEDFILFDASYSASYYETVMQIFDDAGFVPQVSHATVNASSIYRLVENNLGISIVPTSLTEGFLMDVQFIELTKIKQRTTLNMVWNTKNSNPILNFFLGL